MSFFKVPFRAVLSIFSSAKASNNTTGQTNGSRTASGKRSAADAFEPLAPKESDRHFKKRRTEIDVVLVDAERFRNGKSVAEQPAADRALMPPPPKQAKGHRKQPSGSKAPRMSLDRMDTASQATRSTRAGKSDVMDEYDMEEARRKAAATQLPPNSGIWETGERELFFHLSYRGFEPLLPRNWMIDFPTLPLPVFAHQDSDEPLIKCHRSTQFRAIRALEELIDTGTTVRDRTLSNQDLRMEPVLEKAAKKYITWALRDMNYPHKPSKTTIPVHTIATLRPGQSTQDVIRRLASEMHILAAKHREAVNIQPSVEQLAGGSDTLTPPSSQHAPTQIHADLNDNERPLPVIYGVMIASSILAIFTLNSHTAFPPFLVRTLYRNKQPSLTPARAAAINPYLPAQLETMNSSNTSKTNNLTNPADMANEDSGIRYIANFDFSNPAADVWNAFTIAILAMQIRKTMGQVFETWQHIQRESSVMSQYNDIDDPTDRFETASYAYSGSDAYSIDLSNRRGVGDDSWLSNVNDDGHDHHADGMNGMNGLHALSSPTPAPILATGLNLDLVDQLLSSPSRPVKIRNGGRENARKGKGKARMQSTTYDDDDPDA